MILTFEIEAIIDAWLEGNPEKAIALTNQYCRQKKALRCLRCGKELSLRAKHPYCKKHRNSNPTRY
jgi:hypothetical protein